MRVGPWFVLLVSCGGSGSLTRDAGPDPRQPVVSVPVTPNRDLDLLFVVDDSASMADKQNNLIVNFPNFINVLAANIEGGLPNLHLGVVTTDMGTKGTAVAAPGPGVGAVGQGGCSMSGKDGVLQIGAAPISTGNFLSDIKNPDGSRTKNYNGDLATVFGQMARVGAQGCGFEQPLHAMRRALQNTAANGGFLRPEALLGVVFLTDEDDCTFKDPAMLSGTDTTLGPLQSFRCTRFGVTCTGGGQTSDEMNMLGNKTGCTGSMGSPLMDDVAPFHDYLVTLKGNASKVLVAGIIGQPEPVTIETRMINGQNLNALAHSCTYNGGAGPEVADPGVRMKAFFDSFPDHSSFTSVCQPDLSVSLEQLAALVTRSVGSPCVGAAIADVDDKTPGLQVDCIVEDVVGANATVIPKCSNPDTPPCWRLDTDAQNCPQLDHLKLVVVRSQAPDPATVTNMRCRVP